MVLLLAGVLAVEVEVVVVVVVLIGPLNPCMASIPKTTWKFSEKLTSVCTSSMTLG